MATLGILEYLPAIVPPTGIVLSHKLDDYQMGARKHEYSQKISFAASLF
jgi:hypothetical protein